MVISPKNWEFPPFFMSTLVIIQPHLKYFREGLKKTRQIIHILWIRGGPRMWIASYTFIKLGIHEAGHSGAAP